MNKLRAMALVILDKMNVLLTTNPARSIGYGAAVVLWLVVAGLNQAGVTRFGTDLTFEQMLAMAFGILGTLTIVIEGIRRFVFAPMTFIEELSDEAMAAHESAHVEDDMRASLRRFIEAQQAQPLIVAVPPQSDLKN